MISCAQYQALVSENATTDRPFDLPHQFEGDIPHTSLPVEDRNADGPIHSGTPSVDNEAHQEAGDITPRQKPVNVNMSRTSMEDPLVEPRSSLSRESSTQASLPPSCRATTPGLAPSTALDKMGFKPALQVEPLNSLSRQSRMQASHRVTKHGIAPPAALNDLGFKPVQMVCQCPFFPSYSPLTDSAAAASIEEQVHKNRVYNSGTTLPPSFSFSWHHPGSSLRYLQYS